MPDPIAPPNTISLPGARALSGWKTYLVGAAIGIVVALQIAGIIPAQVADKLIEILTGLGLITLRAGVAKLI